MVAALALWAPAAGAATTTTMTIEGRGWGHGIGMCQYGAYGYALHGWSYANIIKHYYTGVTLGKVTNVPIRVLLRDDAVSAVVTDAATYKASWGSATGGSATVTLGAGVTATVTWTGSSYRLTAGSKTWTPGAPITFKPGSSRLKLLTANDNGYVGHYRGTLRIVRTDTGLAIVNTLPLESYLRGVVPRESPASWPLAALEAQAVAARSYAYRSTGGSGLFDVYCTTASQMYGGADGEAASSSKAVAATAGIVPEYKGTPIEAYFFSTSGGHTESISNVWTGVSQSSFPYLVGVPDPYDYYSPYDKWPGDPITRTPASIAAALGFAKGPLRAVYVVKRGTSPRIVKALLIGDGGWTLTDGATLRADLGLRDTWAYFTSLSITPPSGVITYGTRITLGGQLYPALAAGATATLHQAPAGGSWKTSAVKGKVVSATAGGYAVADSVFAMGLTPACNTRYFVSAVTPMAETASSATVLIQVQPAVTIAPTSVTAGDKVTFTGAVRPAAAAAAVWLQTQAQDGSWTDAAPISVGTDGSYSVAWTVAAGTTSLRVSAPASSKYAAGTSPTVTVTAS
jgi:stage II sporulation protein D